MIAKLSLVLAACTLIASAPAQAQTKGGPVKRDKSVIASRTVRTSRPAIANRQIAKYGLFDALADTARNYERDAVVRTVAGNRVADAYDGYQAGRELSQLFGRR